MKPGFIIVLFLLLCISCAQNKPLSDAEKQQITTEIKNISMQIIQAAEKADADAIIKFHYGDVSHDIPEILTPDGKLLTGKEWSDAVKNVFSLITSQEISILSENVNVVDKTTVWYQNVTKALVNFKDSSIVEQNPWSSYFLFKKINDQWKWIAGTEHGHEEIIKPSPLPKDINQLELSKKLLGQWKSENGDTLSIFDQQPFGNAQVVIIKTTVKGKPFGEDRQLWGFDRVHNRLTVMGANKNGGSMVGTLQFNTPTTYTILPYENISNPSYARLRIEGEFPDAQTYVEKIFVKNEQLRSFTYKKIK